MQASLDFKFSWRDIILDTSNSGSCRGIYNLAEDIENPYDHFFYADELYFKGNYLKLTRSRNLNHKKFQILPTSVTAWKVSKYGIFSGPYFPAFGLNTHAGKYRPEKTPYLDTFHAVRTFPTKQDISQLCRDWWRSAVKHQHW